jgi:hypothetical protein
VSRAALDLDEMPGVRLIEGDALVPKGGVKVDRMWSWLEKPA